MSQIGDPESFVKALSFALRDDQVRASLTDIVGESFRQEIAFLKAELKRKDGEIVVLQRGADTLVSRTDSLEQYTRRNSLRLTGLSETDNEDILKRTVDIMNNKMKVEPPLSANDIDRVHRVGRRDASKPRSVIIKFTSYRARHIAMKHRNKKSVRD